MITIINYKMGNLESVLNMLKKVGVKGKITSDADEIMEAEKLILPGVGAFDAGMACLGELGLIEVLNKKVLEQKTPVLGICLGMQLFTKKSEEGSMAGLGWIDAVTQKFSFRGGEKKLKVPHMGWNTITQKKPSRLLDDSGGETRFYFVHSYHLVCAKESDILAATNYGYDFVSAVESENVFGVQFHPEKSHKFGMRILRNFAGL
jgi:glutamine amidotransferase